MKRALAILAACVLFGFTGLAQFSGSWDLTVDLLPSVGLESSFTLEYTVGSWVFSSLSNFDDTYGFTDVTFTASGALGAVTIESNAKFLVNPVWLTYYVGHTQTPTTPLACPIHPTKVESFAGPQMDYWDVTASLDFAGVSAELFFLLQVYDHFSIEAWDLIDPRTGMPTGWVIYDACWDSVGAGWRIKLSGSLNGATITSYTYFNLTELDAKDPDANGCPTIGKRGRDYISIAEDLNCGGGFTEEYLMIEGLSFACTTVDMALKLTCTNGFEYFKAIVRDIPFLPWLNLTAGVKFGLDSKDITLCGDIVTVPGDCLTVGAVIDWTCMFEHNQICNTIDGIIIKNLKLNWELSECTSVSFETVLTQLWPFLPCEEAAYYCAPVPDNSALRSLDGPDAAYLVYSYEEYCADDDGDGFPDEVLVAFDFGEGYGAWYVCKPSEKYFAWEKFSFSFCGPGCCGGNYEITVDTYFGKGYEIERYFARFVSPTWTPEEEPPSTPQEVGEGVCVVFYPDYGAEFELGTLFGWMETVVSASVPMTADISLTLDLDISFLGVEELGVGFSFQF